MTNKEEIEPDLSLALEVYHRYLLELLSTCFYFILWLCVLFYFFVTSSALPNLIARNTKEVQKLLSCIVHVNGFLRIFANLGSSQLGKFPRWVHLKSYVNSNLLLTNVSVDANRHKCYFLFRLSIEVEHLQQPI